MKGDATEAETPHLRLRVQLTQTATDQNVFFMNATPIQARIDSAGLAWWTRIYGCERRNLNIHVSVGWSRTLQASFHVGVCQKMKGVALIAPAHLHLCAKPLSSQLSRTAKDTLRLWNAAYPGVYHHEPCGLEVQLQVASLIAVLCVCRTAISMAQWPTVSPLHSGKKSSTGEARTEPNRPRANWIARWTVCSAHLTALIFPLQELQELQEGKDMRQLR